MSAKLKLIQRVNKVAEAVKPEVEIPHSEKEGKGKKKETRTRQE